MAWHETRFSIWRCHLASIRIPITEIRRPWPPYFYDEHSHTWKDRLYIETGPSSLTPVCVTSPHWADTTHILLYVCTTTSHEILVKHCVVPFNQHIGAEIKWTPFSRRHFQMDFLNEDVWIWIKISLKFVPRGLINNNPALVQTIACRRPSDKPLSEPRMASLLTHICVTGPQCVRMV